MAKKFAQVQTRIGDMTPAELRDWLGDMPDSQVMRSILMSEITAIQEGEPREQRTLRGLWYFCVKSVLSAVGVLHKVSRNGVRIDWARRLSAILADLVREGVTTYRAMSIIDGSRQRQPARDITTAVIDPVRLVGARHPWIILFCEKDTIWPVVQSLADLYGVSAISGGGEPAYSCTEDIVLQIEESDATYQWRMAREGEYPPLTLLSITDYDPSGCTIANAQARQIEEVAGRAIVHERLGVEPDQLDPALLEEKAYELKGDSELDDWLVKTGGVNGQALGIELDVLPLSDLRRMYAEAIESHIDLRSRRDDLREAYIDLAACELLKPDFEEKRRMMIEAVKDHSAWGVIQRQAIPKDLFLRAAVEGKDWISPVETKELFEKHLSQVQQIMRGTLDQS